MGQLNDILRMERAKAELYDEAYSAETELKPCPMCGSVYYEKLYIYDHTTVCGCSDCISEKWAV